MDTKTLGAFLTQSPPCHTNCPALERALNRAKTWPSALRSNRTCGSHREMNEDRQSAQEQCTEVGVGELLRGTLVLLLITLGSAVAILRAEIFPFAAYTMFSRLRTDDFQYCRMYGLPQDAQGLGEAEEVDISDQKFWGLQMHIGRKVGATVDLVERPGTTAEDVEIAMTFLRDLYNKRGREGFHDGPPIKRLRMYRHSWKVRSDLSTFDRPYQRDLMAESPIVEYP